MYGSLDISTSGMIAQRTRMEVITANIVNANSIRDAQGKLNPYRRREVMFAPGDADSGNPAGRQYGVHVQDIAIDPSTPPIGSYQPDHPDAYKTGPYKGYVATTNINPVLEQINLIDASRAYEANIQAAEAAKQMTAQALRLIA